MMSMLVVTKLEIEAQRELAELLAREIEVKKVRLRVLEVLSIKFDKNLQDSRHLLDELKDKIKLLTATSDSVEIQVSKKRSKSKKSAQVSAGSKSFRDVLGDSITARKAHSSIENGNNSPLAVVQPDPVLFKPKKNAKWATAFNLPDETRSIMLSAEVYGWVPEREDCVKYFSRYGPVFGFYEPKGKKICFLKFQNYDSAATAIADSPHYIQGKWIFAYKAKDH